MAACDTRKVLYRYFDDIDSFANEVSTHLRAFARDELPDAGPTTGLTLLPLSAIKAIREAKQAARVAQAKAQESQERMGMESTRAEALALQLAEDATEAALVGKVEKARQRFAQAILGTSNPKILSHAFEFYYRTGDLVSAAEVGKRWQAATEPNSVNRASAYCNLGLVHRVRREPAQAVTMYEKSLALHAELGHKEGMASDYGNLGNVHLTRGELDEAIQMHKKALVLNTELGRKKGMASDYGNLGIVHGMRCEQDQAHKAWGIALWLYEKLGSSNAATIRQRILGLESHSVSGSGKAG